MVKGNEPARWWIGTVPYAEFPDLCDRFDKSVRYAIGQREIGGESGYEHWQLVVNFGKPQRLAAVKKAFGGKGHWEPTLSDAALQYVQKSDTRVAGTQFEFGVKPLRRSRDTDWQVVYDNARCGRLSDIPPDILVRCYNNIRRIESDNLVPVGIERKIYVYWGRTGSGKSFRAWQEAGVEAYPKDPRTKFWDGYRGHESVVMDEFRGGIDIGHILRWFDRYPTIVEVKGSSTVLKAKTIYVTSNLPPDRWYPDLDSETLSALLRRLNIVHFE